LRYTMVTMILKFAALLVSAVAAQQCQNLTIPVSVNAVNMQLNNVAPYPTNQSQVTAFITNYVQIPQPQAMTFVNGTYLNNATYNISATYCPATVNSTNSSRVNPLQILIHGIGFDKSYWDFTDATSYTTPIRAAGYDTLAIDRLGCGTSSTPDGRNQVQTATHIEIVRAITLLARNGTLPQVNKTYTETVHVGHSYGSIITNGLVTKYPNITSGIVLTGFSANSTWVPQTFSAFNAKFANVNAPARFGNRSTRALNNSYLTWSDIYNNELAFFKFPFYNQSVIELDEARKQPVTYGEIITLGAGIGPANFTGPVQVVNGNNDFIFCGGNCSSTGVATIPSVQSTVALLFPKAANFSAYSAPNTGHAAQLHYSNRNTTAAIVSFLKTNGL